MTVYEVLVLAKRSRWKADLPGGLVVFFAIAFGTGVVDENIRTTLAPAVYGSFALIVVLGGIWWQVRRGRSPHRGVSPQGGAFREALRSNL